MSSLMRPSLASGVTSPRRSPATEPCVRSAIGSPKACTLNRAAAVPAIPALSPSPVDPRRRAARSLLPVVAAAAATAMTSPLTAAGVDSTLTTRCRLVVPYLQTHHGEQLVLVGDCEALGKWDAKKGIKLTWCEGHSHVIEIELPIHTTIACKLVVLGDNNAQRWEPAEDNREILLAPSSLAGRAAGYTVIAHWGFPTCSQVLANSLRRSASNSPSPARSPKVLSHNAQANGSTDNPLIAGVKKALAQAGARADRSAVIPGIISSWEEELANLEEESNLVQCQVTVLVPPNGPKLRADQGLVLVGASAALGRWDPAQGLPLERVGEDSPMWTAQCELPLGEGLQAKVVAVDNVSGKAQTWEPCENRSLTKYRGDKPMMITGYWGITPTHCLEVDRLASVAAGSPQVVQLLRQQLAATSSQLDGLRKERDEAKKASEDLEHKHTPQVSEKTTAGRFEMVQLAEQLQTTRRLYETTKREAMELGGAVGVTRQLCDVARRELTTLAKQLEAAKRAYDALAPEVERMEKRLASTSRAFDATKPELVSLEAQLERARSLFDRTLSKIEAAKSLTGSGDFDAAAVRRRSESRVREVQYAK